ncbi:RDD family protein [Parafrigoribacterium mesophilum]|uniref:RDD family protein n=1 Tax=Parafrigoribacterium mesophilum TaxID=433646 RepID=UPI0031FE2BE5
MASPEPDEGELMTGEAVGLDLRPTSFVLRGAGALLDVIVYLGSWLGLVLAINSPVVAGALDDAAVKAVTIASLVFCIVVLPTAVELLTHGKSLGRLVVGARIVRDDGGAIGFRHAFIRALSGVLELFMSLGGIAALFGLLNARTKRMGDILAGTYSQYERVQRRDPAIFGVPVVLVDWARSADVARMPDPLARRIAQFLRQADGLTPETRLRVASQLAAEAARFVSPLPRADPELFLAAVAAVRRERELLALQLRKQRLSAVEPVLTGLPHRFPPRT